MSWTCLCGANNSDDRGPCGSCGRVLFDPTQIAPPKRKRWLIAYGLLILILSLVAAFSVNRSYRKAPIDSFTTPIQKGVTAEALVSFIEQHRGKLLRINVDIDYSLSSILRDGERQYLTLRSEPCKSEEDIACGNAATLVFSGKEDDYELQYYKGGNRLSGYFVVDENVEMNRGVVYGLKAVPAAEVLLSAKAAGTTAPVLPFPAEPFSSGARLPAAEKSPAQSEGAKNCLSIQNADSSVVDTTSVYVKLSWKADVANSCAVPFHVRVVFDVFDKDDFLLVSDEQDVSVPENGTGRARKVRLVSNEQAPRIAKRQVSIAEILAMF